MVSLDSASLSYLSAYSALPKESYATHPNKHFLTKVPTSIGIIGAGVSGLITAKVLKSQGYDIEILEKRDYFGGVWYLNYEGAGLQARYTHYNMPDHCFPEGSHMLPKQEEVMLFLERYVERFGLRELIRLNAGVEKVTQMEDGSWTVLLEDGERKMYDFLVLCSGSYHKPYIPQFPGISSFQGTVLHSSAFRNIDSLCQGKRVLVIGGQKSAFDIMHQAGDHGARVTCLMREIHWSIPMNLKVFGIRIGYYLYTRFACLFLPSITARLSLFERLLKPVSWLYWKFIAVLLSENLPKALRPTTDLIQERLTQIMSRDEVLVDRIRNKEVEIVKGKVDQVIESGVISGGKFIPADVIVLATGFRRSFFGLNEEVDGLWAYRNIIVPDLKNFAIIGISQPVYTLLHTNLQAVWLSELLRGAMPLPSLQHMAKDLNAKRRRVRAQLRSEKRSYIWCGSDVNDVLMRDMGLRVRRTRSWYEHWFHLPNPADYESVLVV